MAAVDVHQLYTRAEQLLDEGKLQPAADLCQQMLAINPQCAEGYHLMSSLFRRTGNYEKAVLFSRMAIDRDPTVADFYMQQGQSLFALNKWEEAFEAFSKAHALAPQNAIFIVLQATTLTQQKKFDAALALFAKARGLADLPEIDEHEGICRLQKGDVVAGEAMFDRVIARRPDYEWGYVYKGKLLLSQAKEDEATGMFNRALSLNAGNVEALQGLAVIQRRQAKIH